MQLLPHVNNTDGFFAAVLERTGKAERAKPVKRAVAEESAE